MIFLPQHFLPSGESLRPTKILPSTCSKVPSSPLLILPEKKQLSISFFSSSLFESRHFASILRRRRGHHGQRRRGGRGGHGDPLGDLFRGVSFFISLCELVIIFRWGTCCNLWPSLLAMSPEICTSWLTLRWINIIIIIQGCTNRCSLAAGLRGNEERMRK